MANTRNPRPDSDHPTVYQIRIKGHLDQRWSDWFEGLALTQQDDGETLLTGPVVDQAALFGVLSKVRNLGLPLLSINLVTLDGEDAS
jgi:hypothetical protein